MNREEFKNIASSIPLKPGIYKYFDAAGTIIYIGKAKELRKRVGSYFTQSLQSNKTFELVKQIRKIEFTITNSEQDALFLEGSLVKQFQPKFNIDLKDDKSYPYIVIKNEPFPRIFLTRKKYNDGSEYLGPFISVGKVRELITFIKEHIPLRTCKLNLSKKNIEKGKFKVCLEYHLGNCKGPCEGFQSEEDYTNGLNQIRNLLKGNLSPVIRHFKNEMKERVDKMEFEQAELIRKKIEHLQQYKAKSEVVNPKLGDMDVFSILKENDTAYVNYLMVENGTVIQTKTVQLTVKLEETDAEVLSFAISSLRSNLNSVSKNIIVPFSIDYPEEGVIITVPKAGDKKKLLDLSEKNVQHFKEELYRRKVLHLEEKTDAEKKDILYQLQTDLQLSLLPLHIECFDNSNFQGSFPVSAMVCFKNGLPSKKDYRRFDVQSVEGINDFATMQKVVYRRYARLKEEKQALPQLVIIDGGKGQLNAALKSIDALKLTGKMTLVGLAKNEEEIFFSGDQHSIKLPWNSESLKLIRRIRDEVHRFGIEFHRKKRSKGTFVNELENIKGIGKQTARQLLKEFKSVKLITALAEQDIAKLIGPSKAKLVKGYFERKK